uniref:Nuclear protein 1 n=1 Tax=Octopus bimaculoides TaxID=37653 RepID=A0A0L8HYH4_OCTBM
MMTDFFVANYMDEYDVMSMYRDQYIHVGHSGKGRSKKEAREHTNRHDPNGHNRKTLQKLMNNSYKNRARSNAK